MVPRLMGTFVAAWLVLSAATAQDRALPATEWTIDGVKREALIIPPSKNPEGPSPVLFVFHGHGGNMRNFARKGFQREWPEAIVVCPQGLPTATPRDPQGDKPGWDSRNPADDNRDLKFFDAILKTLREKHKVDDSRIYATGHSNGGGFTYLLWAARGNQLAAVAPSSAPGTVVLATAKDLKPLPVLHLAGRKDPIVPFPAQQQTMDECRKRLGCEGEGREWANAGPLVGTLYPSPNGTPFVSLIHPGGHEFPAEAPGLIVKFLKEQTKK